MIVQEFKGDRKELRGEDRRVSYAIKSILDRTIAAIMLLCLTPILIIVAIAVHLGMGDPILFTQTRCGRNAKIFKIYKFRSMTNECDADGNLLEDEDRLTSFGKFIRRFKLDEILQLWNIVKGDMSFVGPRPTLPEQVRDYYSWQKERLKVTPGLTGWSQVNGNVNYSWTERICMDIWYLHNWSLWLDMRILIKTASVVIWGEHKNHRAFNQAWKYVEHSLKVDLTLPVQESMKSH
ncbi:MAG: sugar transferase [Rivularia sp. (in: Bacteria)]|nr:sugar transferase [Rivularia sp. MS3]